MRSFFDTKTMGLLLIMLGFNTGLFLYFNTKIQKQRAPEIVTFKMLDINSSFVNYLAKKPNLTKELIDKKVENFGHELLAKIKKMSKKYNLIIISKPAVASDVPDVTFALKKMMGLK